MTDPENFSRRMTVIRAAESWLGTPYHAMGRVKGAGVDCLTLLAEIYAEAGLIETPEIPYYPPDWHLHRSNERYLEGLLRYAAERGAPAAGDIALWRFGSCYSHGYIVVECPNVIHALMGRGVRRENAETAAFLSGTARGGVRVAGARLVRFFSIFT